MKIDEKGLKIIKEFEGFRSAPYLCDALVPTIGYGTTHYINRPVSMNDESISEKTAEDLLRAQVDATYGKAVNHYVRVPISQNQFDALVSFTYNAGVEAFKTSTLLKDINHGKLIDADQEFAKWVHVNGKVDRGLVARRKKEAKLFMT